MRRFGLAFAFVLALVPAVPAAASQASVVSVHRWDAEGRVPGTVVHRARAVLVRGEGGVSMRLRTTGLIPGHAYTIWWAIYNAPENCTGLVRPPAEAACGDPDWAYRPAEPATIWAAGGVAGAGGARTFTGNLATGDTTHDIMPLEEGLTDPAGAEIWFVVRDHGPSMDGSDQTTTFNGGCANYVPGLGGTPWTYTCRNSQLATFPAG